MCTKPNHMSRNCQGRKCFLCKGNHHSSICNGSGSFQKTKNKKEDKDNEKEDNHSGWVRRSSRQRKTSFSSHAQEMDPCLSDETHQSAESGVRRSKRAHHKPSFYDPVAYDKHQSTSEDEDEEEEQEEEEEEEEGKFHISKFSIVRKYS